MQRDRDDLARVDPLWAILAEPTRKDGRWELEEFFERGRRDVESVLEVASDLGAPRLRERALDFGCGVGRLTRALAPEFDECYGVDISPEMIRLARELNADRANCRFVVNAAPDLSLFESDTFDFVIAFLVLQHLRGGEQAALGYVREFLRVTRPGGLVVFQLPASLPFPSFQPRVRLYGLLRSVGLNADFLYRRAELDPMRMIAVPDLSRPRRSRRERRPSRACRPGRDVSERSRVPVLRPRALGSTAAPSERRGDALRGRLARRSAPR